MRFLKIAAILPFLTFLTEETRAFHKKENAGEGKELQKEIPVQQPGPISLKFSGYIQPQFQFTEKNGAKTYAGGDFPENSSNRFMLRRSRLKADFSLKNKEEQTSVKFIFQIDATERGVYARDIYGQFHENKWQIFHLTTGLFARPFSYELIRSSSERETPERGRMSQILMKTERDLGAMVSFEPRKENAALKNLKIDLGVFNGQGLAGPEDYDSYKDLIGRISLKPVRISRSGIRVSGGVSVLYGFVGNQSYQLYKLRKSGGNYIFHSDSLRSNKNYAAPRQYYGADVQFKIPNRKGNTELRAEYIRGTQSATAASSETPGKYPIGSNGIPAPLYIRPFDGAYFYLLQNLFSEKHQIVLKYDWYDPNTKLSGKEISPDKKMSAADIRFNTLGFGYTYYIDKHFKATVYYDQVKNEETALPGYVKDRSDDVFTLRLQYEF